LDKKRVAIIGSHGIYANYGGWDQLVNNLAELKSRTINYLIFNPIDNSVEESLPEGVKVVRLPLKANGVQGILYDYLSILKSYWTCDSLLLLGIQGMPLIFVLNFFFRRNIVVNLGGIEWERPQFNFFARIYLLICFKMIHSSKLKLIIDNKYYEKFIPSQKKCSVHTIPYGGTIDKSKLLDSTVAELYYFIKDKYFLSISRSIEDNGLKELCESFIDIDEHLVLISNFSNSQYGTNVFKAYSSYSNIHLINGLYDKPILDLIRRKCYAYIHTHTLCGTAPSLVEMIRCERPIISIDVPQNRFTLNNLGIYFSNFTELKELLSSNTQFKSLNDNELFNKYDWKSVVGKYENLFN